MRLTVFGQGLRPFFLLAGLDGIFNVVMWLSAWFHPDIWPQGALPAMLWHGHEMLFGFIAAAIAGFLLTAVPGWTGRSSYAGAPLILLAAIWLAGRVAMFPPLLVPHAAAATIDLAFFPAVVITLAPALIAARKFRNLPFLVLLTGLFAADLLFQLGAGVIPDGELIGLGVAIDIITILVTVVGGRIIPAFTRSGLARRGAAIAIKTFPLLDQASIASVVAVLAADVVLPHTAISGATALIAGLVNAARLVQWKGWCAFRDPLIWVLHLGYAWLVLGLLLKGAWLVADAGFAAKWLHALTIGGFGTMILAVMTRASLGHTGRALAAPAPMAIGYALVTVAALIRVFGPAVAPDNYDATIALAGASWIAAFLLFVAVYAPILTRPRVDGRPG